MSLHARLHHVERRTAGWLQPRITTWQGIVAAFQELPEEERISFAAAYGTMHKMPPGVQERAHRMYCDQQGIPYVHRSSPYSGPDPPPPPFFPEPSPASRKSPS